jgi:hypothetical protein
MHGSALPLVRFPGGQKSVPQRGERKPRSPAKIQEKKQETLLVYSILTGVLHEKDKRGRVKSSRQFFLDIWHADCLK